jgi:hypothetical protein
MRLRVPISNLEQPQNRISGRNVGLMGDDPRLIMTAAQPNLRAAEKKANGGNRKGRWKI